MTKTVMLEATTTEISSTEEQQYEFIKMMECLAPWKEKTNDEESIGSWETTMATRMMLKNGAANQHYRTICKMLREDMPQLMFANHMKYMMRTYGPKKIKR